MEPILVINWVKRSVHLVMGGGEVIQAVITMVMPMVHTIMATHLTMLDPLDSMELVIIGLNNFYF